jgi:topoisomerase-4 subunit A
MSASLNLHTYIENAYLRYSLKTVRDRALAQVEDGMKPVQRRILYAMHKLGLVPTAKPVKAARVVGDVIGKYHPHGDTAVYDAMVRMAQSFTLRYPLVDGQGNFGSLDGDSPAAMRYTEARLSPLAELLLSELQQGAVDFIDNYDGSHTEPSRLPARLPILLLNGTMGVAVGMASSIPPHNLREVAAAAAVAVSRPTASDDELLAPITGPDFAGGGVLVATPEEVAKVYATGSGPLRVRAKFEYEELARGQWRLVVVELPPEVSPSKVLGQLDSLTAPVPPSGKKAITPQQAALRQTALDLMERAVDESSRHGLRLVIYPRTSKVPRDALEQFLLANTSLESPFHCNFTWLRADGSPVTTGLAEILRDWATFRVAAVRKRTRSALDKLLARIHLLEGRALAFAKLEEVIRVIKESDDPSQALQAEFGLTEIQAKDILEMRLRQLSRLEGFAIEKETADARKEAARLEDLLASERAMRNLVTKEVEADAARYGDDRRTLRAPEAPAKRRGAQVLPVKDEPATVMITDTLWVKLKPGHDLATETFKKGHALRWQIPTSTAGHLVLLDEGGRAYSVPVRDLASGRSDGEPLSKHLDLTARPAYALSGAPESKLILAGKGGYGFITTVANLICRQRAGKQVLTLADGELPLAAPVAGSEVAVVGSNGRMLVFPVAEVKELPRGKGVKLIGLKRGETLDTIVVFDGALELGGIRIEGDALEKYRIARGGKGCALPVQKPKRARKEGGA